MLCTTRVLVTGEPKQLSGGEHVSAYAAPARAQNLSGLPRTYIDAGSAESFQDEALTYARRLSESGVSVDFHMWGGGFHGFDLMAPQAARSKPNDDEPLHSQVGGPDCQSDRRP
jgi:acetyl esterase/lipase